MREESTRRHIERGLKVFIAIVIPLAAAGCGKENTPTAPGSDKTPPGAVQNLRVTGTTTSSIALAWTAPGDDGTSGRASQYMLRYYDHAPAQLASWWDSAVACTAVRPPSQAGAPETLTVAGLASATTYYFSLKTLDSSGNCSDFSNVASWRTYSAVDTLAPSAVTDLAARRLSETSVMLTWTAPGEDRSQGTAALYDIRYATSPLTYYGNWFSAMQVTNEPTPSPAGSKDSVEIDGLHRGDTYYFGLGSYDHAYNLSKLSNIAVLSAQCGTPRAILVRPDGVGEFATIQAAVDGACSGDTILLADGTFQGYGNRDIDLKGKALVVRSRSGNPATCVIDCLAQGRGFYLHSLEGADTRIENLTVKNGLIHADPWDQKPPGSAILCENASPTLTNCVFSSNTVTLLHGAACFRSSSSRLVGCRFEHNSGGGLFSVGSRLELESCVFVGNSVDDETSGGGIEGSGSSLIAQHCVFDSNTAGTDAAQYPVSRGGAISFSLDAGGSLDLLQCRFTGNKADFGGAISVRQGTPHIEDCTFTGNTARSEGGAIDGESSSPILVSCTFDHNSANDYGGAIWLLSSALSASGNVFTVNHAGTGGAIAADAAVKNAGSIDITESRFAGNTAGTGGAIEFPHGSSFISECAFEGNVSDAAGGAIHAWDAIHIENCTFDRNIAKAGAGVYAGGGSLLALCTFRENHAVYDENAGESGWGGGLYCSGGNPTVNGCRFEGNTADLAGGGLLMNLSAAHVNDCTFIENTAGEGGGLFAWFSSQPRLARCVFSGNRATTAGGGGVHHISFGSPFFSRSEFVDCSFSGNSAATNGGGVSNDDAEISLLRCIFDGNSAGQDGGGLSSTQGAWLKPPSLDHCEFYNNAAVGAGGGILLNRFDVSQLQYCTIAGNSAGSGGGIYFVNPGSSGITLQNCTIYLNNASSGQGGGIAMEVIHTPADVHMYNTIIASSASGEAVYQSEPLWAWTNDVSCCDFYGNAGGDWTGNIAESAGLNGNFSVDPLFCIPSNFIFMLQPGSPCNQDESGCGLIGAWPAGCGARAKGMNALWRRPVRVRR
jgi:predicted outer membrane repeat protein